MSAEIGSFKQDGKVYPTITLRKDGEKAEGAKKYGFSFGIAKARLIVQHIEEIKGFVETEGKQ